MAGSILAVVLSLAWGFSPGAAVLLWIWTSATLALWLWARTPDDWTEMRATITLTSCALAVPVAFALSDKLSGPEYGSLVRFVQDIPIGFFGEQEPGTLLAGFGVFFFLLATANGLIRLLLTVVGTPPIGEQDLRGGRIIGPLERLLIWGLGLAGEPTAAALVIAAKGLLRFPEISREAEDRLHAVTEYLLVGSLASWSLALAAIPLVAT